MSKWVNILKGYSVSDNGSVRNDVTGLILTNNLTGSGYYNVKVNGETYTIHKLVAKAFISCTDNSLVVNHKDGNKLNNHFSNLEWVTSSDNQKHAYATGLRISVKGNNHGLSKLTEEAVIEIKKLLIDGVSQLEISKLFGVSKSAISHISRGFTWSHIHV